MSKIIRMRYHSRLLILSVILAFTSCSEHYRIKKTMSEFTKSKIVITDRLYMVKDRTYVPANIDNLCDMKLIIYCHFMNLLYLIIDFLC